MPVKLKHLRLSVEVILLVFVIMAMSQAANLSKQEMTALETVTQGTNKFAVSLYRALSKNQSGNVFVSPLSVQMVLALAYTGAKGNTAKELATLLMLPDQIESTFSGYNSLIKVLQDPVLKLANRMFVEATAGVKQEFQTNAEKYFLAPAESKNFRGAADQSRQDINTWVEDQTNKKITNLLAPGTISSDTRLVLVNAIHFKADWRQKFREEDTKEQPFHVSKTQTVPVQMMNAKKKFGFAYDSELKSKILQLDYAGKNFRMLVILPDEIDGLPELEAKLENVNLSEKVKYMEEPTVTVALPKFKLEETMELNDILKSLGAGTMFNTQSADFSGLSEEKLVVSKVIQKAFVEVNEKGTEAAAATGMMFMAMCAPIKPPPDEVFIADHPFIFFITHYRHNTPLFLGSYSTPE